MAPTQPVPIATWDVARDAWIRIPPQDMLPCFERSDVWSETFPVSGTCLNGTVYELPTSGHLTGDSESSSLLPTPVADHSRGLPQPGTAYQSLPNVVMDLLPTPESSDATGGRMSSEVGGVRPSGAKRAITLATRIGALLPTLTAADSKASGGSSPSDVTLTDAVVRTSLGASTNPRFDGGNGC